MADDLGASYYVALGVFTLLVCYLSSKFFTTAPAGIGETGLSKAGSSSRGKKKKAKGKQDQPKEQSGSEDFDDASGKNASSEEADTKKKPVTLKKPKAAKAKAAAQAALEGSGEDDEGFAVSVGKKARSNAQQLGKMTDAEKKAYLKRKADLEDASWDHVGAGGKVTKASSNAYSTSVSVAGRKVPPKKQGRTVEALSDSAMAERLQQLAAHKEALPAVTCDIKVHVQGQWYPITELLETNDFSHAPSMVKCYAQAPDSCRGGLFMNIGGKDWMGEVTSDEIWMITTLLKPLTQLVGTDDETSVKVSLFVDDKMSSTTSLATKEKGGKAVVTVQHLHVPSKISSIAHTVALEEFTATLLPQLEAYSTYARRMDIAFESQVLKNEALKETNPAKAERMLDGLSNVCQLSNRQETRGHHTPAQYTIHRSRRSCPTPTRSRRWWASFRMLSRRGGRT